MKPILTFTIILFCTLNIFSQAPGSLDLSFDTDGKVTTSIDASDDAGNSVALQSDGKIIVAGYSSNGLNKDFALVRYNVDGSLDNTFSGDGIQTTDFSNSMDVINAVAIQSDGKIIAAGYTDPGNDTGEFALARYNIDGSLDITFDGDGKLVTSFGINDDGGTSIVLQTDGKILVGGYCNNGADYDFAVVRYDLNGSLDNSFDLDGKVNFSVAAGDEVGWSIAIQSDDKILVGGYSSNGANDDFTVIRLNTDGGLDNSFDMDGVVTTDFTNYMDGITGLAIQADGKIIGAGYTNDGTYVAVARYNLNGSIDSTFDSDGRVITNVGLWGGASSIAIQPDGKMLVAGYSNNSPTQNNFSLQRYNIDGSLDNSFDTDGKLYTDFTNDNDYGNSIVIQPDLKIIVAGSANNGVNDDFALARYISGLNVGMLDFSIDDNSVLIYPNPLMHDCKLKYTLATDESISITLLDMSGKVIDCFLNNEAQLSGTHEQILHFPTGLFSGTYFVVISTPHNKISLKVILN